MCDTGITSICLNLQQVTLPSYEEALRESTSNGNALPEYDNPLANGTAANGLTNGLANGGMPSNGLATNGLSADGVMNGSMTHPQPQQSSQHFRFHANGRVSRTTHPIAAAATAASSSNGGVHHGRRSRHPAGTGGGNGGLGRFADNVDSLSHHSAQATYPAAALQQHR